MKLKTTTLREKQKQKQNLITSFLLKSVCNRKQPGHKPAGLKDGAIECTSTFDSIGEESIDSSNRNENGPEIACASNSHKSCEKLTAFPSAKSSDISDSLGTINPPLESNDMITFKAGDGLSTSLPSNTSQKRTLSSMRKVIDVDSKSSEYKHIETECNINDSTKIIQVDENDAEISMVGERFSSRSRNISSQQSSFNTTATSLKEDDQTFEQKHVETGYNSYDHDEKLIAAGVALSQNNETVTSAGKDINPPTKVTTNDITKGKLHIGKRWKSHKFKLLKLMKAVRQVFKGHKQIKKDGQAKEIKKDGHADMQIGLRLALPDKIDIMRGMEPPGRRTATENVKMNPKSPVNPFLSSYPITNKKIMIIKASNGSKIKKLLGTSKSAIKVPTQKKIRNRNDNGPYSLNQQSSYKIEKINPIKEITLRTSELDPSVHQIVIPSTVDLLFHARVCALMESYDRLLQSRAKACKRWFNFAELVGLTRSELENMYLTTIGKCPQIPLYVGQGADTGPPPLPRIGKNHLGSHFSSGRSIVPHQAGANSFSSAATGEKSSLQGKHQMISILKQKTGKPDRTILKSLLECADDIIVEDYFTETIGHEAGMPEDSETTGVQVVLFSSQRQRQIIVCFRGSMNQHEKPIKSKSPKLDARAGKKKLVLMYDLLNFVAQLLLLTLQQPYLIMTLISHNLSSI